MELFDQTAAPTEQEEVSTPQQELIWVKVSRFHDNYYLASIARGTRFIKDAKFLAFTKTMFEELVRQGRSTKKNIVNTQ